MTENESPVEGPELTDVVAYCAAISSEWDYLPNPGNLGDSLIVTGTFRAFTRAGVALSHYDDSPERVDRPVLVAGGGNLVRYYDELAPLLHRLQATDVSRVVLLPHTIEGQDALLGALDDRFEIFCRERSSFAYVRSLRSNFVGLDHDMATRVDPEFLVAAYEELIPTASHHLLRIMERITTGAAELSRRNRRFGSLLRTDVEAVPGRITGDNMDLSGYGAGAWGSPMVSPEVTVMMAATFMRAMSMFDEIETDRLHVAIGAGLLGIPTLLHANAYHKNASVYALTVSRLYPCVRMAE